MSPAPRRLVYRAVVDPTVDFLAHLAGMGSALELGIGTGRVALPLSRRGVQVPGIDFSPAMVGQLQRREGAAATDVTIGDFATTRPGGTFRLVCLLRNTITNLTHPGRAFQTFHNVAAQLQPGSSFVIENYIPELRRLPPGETTRLFTATSTTLATRSITLRRRSRSPTNSG